MNLENFTGLLMRYMDVFTNRTVDGYIKYYEKMGMIKRRFGQVEFLYPYAYSLTDEEEEEIKEEFKRLNNMNGVT